MSKQELRNLLSDGCQQMKIELSELQVDQFLELTDLLIRWNKKINLTSITKPNEVITKRRFK